MIWDLTNRPRRWSPETGEVYFESGELSRKYRSQLRAAEHRIGNVSEVNSLRDAITQLVGRESTILQKILWSGTHSGDVIPAESMSQLTAEINLMSGESGQSPELRRFVSSLEELVQTAENEGNPIVFV